MQNTRIDRWMDERDGIHTYDYDDVPVCMHCLTIMIPLYFITILQLQSLPPTYSTYTVSFETEGHAKQCCHSLLLSLQHISQSFFISLGSFQEACCSAAFTGVSERLKHPWIFYLPNGKKKGTVLIWCAVFTRNSEEEIEACHTAHLHSPK